MSVLEHCSELNKKYADRRTFLGVDDRLASCADTTCTMQRTADLLKALIDVLSGRNCNETAVKQWNKLYATE